MLDLVEDVARDDGQDSLRPAAPLELGQHHADLDGLAEAHRVGNQEARLKLTHGHPERLPLERQVIGQRQVANGQVDVGDRYGRAPDEALEDQAGLDAVGQSRRGGTWSASGPRVR